jgi:hypothetical protein
MYHYVIWQILTNILEAPTTPIFREFLSLYPGEGGSRFLRNISRKLKYGRNVRRLVVYVSERVAEISANKKEILWIGLGRKIAHI